MRSGPNLLDMVAFPILGALQSDDPQDLGAGSNPSDVLSRVREELSALDRAISGAVASTPTPTLDRPMQWLSNAANNSKLWVATSAGLALLGGPPGRRAGLHGLIAIGVTSLTANAAAKQLFPRYRPERLVPNEGRDVRMPTSSSFPSGHSASAFAFATVVSAELPEFSLLLHGLATAVAYSRVHTGVHYPSDVLAGSVLGSVVGTAVWRALTRHRG